MPALFSARNALRFTRCRDGAIGVMFVLAFMPLVAIAGAAIDYGAALKTETALTAALDAALQAARRRPDLAGEDLKAYATDFFRANGGMERGVERLELAVWRSERAVLGHVAGRKPTTLLSIAGVPYLAVSASGSVAF